MVSKYNYLSLKEGVVMSNIVEYVVTHSGGETHLMAEYCPAGFITTATWKVYHKGGFLGFGAKIAWSSSQDKISDLIRATSPRSQKH